MDEVAFTKHDLPLLLEQVNTVFPDDSERYNTAGGFILESISGLAQYLSLDKKAELYNNKMIQKRGQQFNVLGMLVNDADTAAGIKKAGELLLAAPPQKGSPYLLTMVLTRHKQKAVALYPALFALAGDSISGYTVCMMANTLIDSGYLSLEKLTESIPLVIAKSREQRLRENGYSAYNILRLLKKFKTAEAWEEIKQYQYSESNYVRNQAVELLCEHDITPDAKVIDSLAADKYFRIAVYELLIGKNLMQLYPKKYLTQAYFAESYMAGYDEDDAYSKIIPLGMKKTLYKNRMQKFYLFELRGEDPDEKPSLGIAGPFSDNNDIATINEESNAVGIYSEPLDKRNLETQLVLYLIKRKIGPRQSEQDEN